MNAINNKSLPNSGLPGLRSRRPGALCPPTLPRRTKTMPAPEILVLTPKRLVRSRRQEMTARKKRDHRVKSSQTRSNPVKRAHSPTPTRGPRPNERPKNGQNAPNIAARTPGTPRNVPNAPSAIAGQPKTRNQKLIFA